MSTCLTDLGRQSTLWQGNGSLRYSGSRGGQAHPCTTAGQWSSRVGRKITPPFHSNCSVQCHRTLPSSSRFLHQLQPQPSRTTRRIGNHWRYWPQLLLTRTRIKVWRMDLLPPSTHGSLTGYRESPSFTGRPSRLRQQHEAPSQATLRWPLLDYKRNDVDTFRSIDVLTLKRVLMPDDTNNADVNDDGTLKSSGNAKPLACTHTIPLKRVAEQ
jgi:hypothetical protein